MALHLNQDSRLPTLGSELRSTRLGWSMLTSFYFGTIRLGANSFALALSGSRVGKSGTTTHLRSFIHSFTHSKLNQPASQAAKQPSSQTGRRTIKLGCVLFCFVLFYFTCKTFAWRWLYKARDHNKPDSSRELEGEFTQHSATARLCNSTPNTMMVLKVDAKLRKAPKKHTGELQEQ